MNQHHIDETIIALTHSLEGDDESAAEEKKVADETLEEVDVHRAFLTIDGQTIPFQTVTVLDGKLSLRIPKTFRLMRPEEARLKYPSEHRPEFIFTDETHTLNLAFNLTSTLLDESELEDFQQAMCQMMRSTQPIERWLGEHEEIIDERKTGACDFVIPTLNSSVYNLMLFASVNDRALLITFNCLEEQQPEWKPVAQAMLRSIRWNAGDIHNAALQGGIGR